MVHVTSITLPMRGAFTAGCPYMVVDLNEEWEDNHSVGSDTADMQNRFQHVRDCWTTFEKNTVL